jgi:tRNA U34 2-thiouridine synthase MnmA/TrmU
MKDFLKEYIDIKPGEIREIESEKVLGYHEGAVFYTIGQRHGLYLDGVKGEVNDGLPYYVVAKDIPNNIVYVSKNLNDEHIWTDELELKDVVIRGSTGRENYFSGLTSQPSTSYTGTRAEPSLRDEPVRSVRNIRLGLPNLKQSQKSNFSRPVNISVRLRHRAPLIPAKFDGTKLYFENKIKRPASGQSAVLYDGEICLGGGIIA